MAYQYSLEKIRAIFSNYINCTKVRAECDGDCKYCMYDYKDSALGQAVRTFMANCDDIGIVYPPVFKRFFNCYNTIHRCNIRCTICRSYYDEVELIEGCQRAIEMIDNLEV